MRKSEKKCKTLRKMVKIGGNFAKNCKKMRKRETDFNHRGRKGHRDFLDRMTGFFKPRKGTKSTKKLDTDLHRLTRHFALATGDAEVRRRRAEGR